MVAAPASQKKTPAQGGRQVIEAGFIQARNLSSSKVFIRNYRLNAKHKVCASCRTPLEV